jgi:hypothetical protein
MTMTPVLELLSFLSARGVGLWPNGDGLRYAAPPGVITEQLRAELV